MACDNMQKSMHHYENMRDSGIEWIGEVPSHWKTTRMKAIFRAKSVKNHPNAEVLSLYRDFGVLPKSSRDDNHNVTSEDTSQYKYVEKGNLVINKMKAWQGSLAISKYEGIVSPAYYVCEFRNAAVDKNYIHHLLRCVAYAQEFERLSTGMRIGQWDLGIDDFMLVPVILPPLNEQKHIGHYLDAQCLKIDTIISDAKTSIAEYKAWKSSIIYEAVTKGLDRNVEMKDSGVDIIGYIPKNWTLRRLKFLCSVMTGNQDTQNAVDNAIYPFYVRSPIVEHSNVYTYEGEGVLMAGDGAGAGRVFHHAFGKYAIHQRVYCFHDFHNILPDYFYYFMSELFKHEMDKGSAQSTVPSVRMPMIANFQVCLPPIDEQRHIVKAIEKNCKLIDSVIAEKEQLIVDLADYKKSLIFEGVTGKRRIIN